MTALSANYEAKRQDGEILSYPVLANAVIYKGALLVDAGTGYVQPGSGVGVYTFIGVAAEAATGGSTDGAVRVRVYKKGVFQYTKASAVAGDLGVKMYLHDDQTVGTSSTNTNFCGYCVDIVDGSTIKLQIDAAVN